MSDGIAGTDGWDGVDGMDGMDAGGPRVGATGGFAGGLVDGPTGGVLSPSVRKRLGERGVATRGRQPSSMAAKWRREWKVR